MYKKILAFFQVVCDLFKLKHVYILPISPILNVRPYIYIYIYIPLTKLIVQFYLK